EMVGRCYVDFVHPAHQDRVFEGLARQYSARTAITYDEFPARHRDGQWVWIGQNVRILLDGPKVTGFQAVARDITQRKEAELALEHEREQLKDIVTHAPVAMAILDRD